MTWGCRTSSLASSARFAASVAPRSGQISTGTQGRSAAWVIDEVPLLRRYRLGLRKPSRSALGRAARVHLWRGRCTMPSLQRRERRRAAAPSGRVQARWRVRARPHTTRVWYQRIQNERGRQLRRPLLVHVADGGSISGASGVTSRDAAGSSTRNFRSAAFSINAAEILGSLVALANLNRISA